MVVRPTMDEEIFMRDRFEKGKDWYTVEGAFYFRKGDWHYVTYSGTVIKVRIIISDMRAPARLKRI